ncbi:hypothetical protein [Variovorax sp. Sphag1AA]|uniref:hypothetical protein n=1 Tax=Variovorax sp. Sphag1AA TaxID=2587027 RepID=UPI0016183E1F|nr:hypothetical protein [Variovorax sp. Sphag1AA]MBB3181978.1 hypothetical protein [Variovorax sp. Sphag1AA]
MTQALGIEATTWTAVLAGALLTGCAGVDFYSDADLSKKTGIPIYGAKPYVLVSRTQNKDKPVEVSIQYLTDRSQVIYANPRSGFGSSDLKLTLDHGQLTQFGQITDTKIPELITAVSGLLTSRATAAKDYATADQIRRTPAGGTEQAAKIPDAATLEAMKSLLSDMSSDKATKALAGLEANTELPVVEAVKKNLASILEANGKPESANLIPAFGDQLIESAKAFAKLPAEPAAPSARTTALQLVTAWKPKLEAIVAKITPDAPAAADFELYEIIQNGASVTLRRVQ